MGNLVFVYCQLTIKSVPFLPGTVNDEYHDDPGKIALLGQLFDFISLPYSDHFIEWCSKEDFQLVV